MPEERLKDHADQTAPFCCDQKKHQTSKVTRWTGKTQKFYRIWSLWRTILFGIDDKKHSSHNPLQASDIAMSCYEQRITSGGGIQNSLLFQIFREYVLQGMLHQNREFWLVIFPNRNFLLPGIQKVQPKYRLSKILPITSQGDTLSHIQELWRGIHPFRCFKQRATDWIITLFPFGKNSDWSTSFSNKPFFPSLKGHRGRPVSGLPMEDILAAADPAVAPTTLSPTLWKAIWEYLRGEGC